MQNITGNGYSIQYNAETATIHCQGIMRLDDKGYESIISQLYQVATFDIPKITLDLRELEMLNSSGVAMFSGFVSIVEEKKATQLVIQLSKQFDWQKRSVGDFQLMMPTVQIEWE